MSGALNLDFAYLRGELLGEDPKQYLDLEPAPWAEYSDLEDQGNRTSKAIQDFLVHGHGRLCPLRDLEAHPQS